MGDKLETLQVPFFDKVFLCTVLDSTPVLEIENGYAVNYTGSYCVTVLALPCKAVAVTVYDHFRCALGEDGQMYADTEFHIPGSQNSRQPRGGLSAVGVTGEPGLRGACDQGIYQPRETYLWSRNNPPQGAPDYRFAKPHYMIYHLVPQVIDFIA